MSRVPNEHSYKITARIKMSSDEAKGGQLGTFQSLGKAFVKCVGLLYLS